jgi:hypothetical protein
MVAVLWGAVRGWDGWTDVGGMAAFVSILGALWMLL